MKTFELSFVCEELDLSEETIRSWIVKRLVQPVDIQGPYFDEEDVSRLRLISEMRTISNANDEALQVILHLVDQIHLLQSELKNSRGSSNE